MSSQEPAETEFSRSYLPIYRLPMGSFHNWPKDQKYEGLPLGEKLEHYVHVLEGTGIAIPQTLQDRKKDVQCRNAILMKIYNEADHLVAHRSKARRAGTQETLDVLVLGTPDKRPTQQQKETVAKMMGLTVEDIVNVEVVDY